MSAADYYNSSGKKQSGDGYAPPPHAPPNYGGGHSGQGGNSGHGGSYNQAPSHDQGGQRGYQQGYGGQGYGGGQGGYGGGYNQGGYGGGYNQGPPPQGNYGYQQGYPQQQPVYVQQARPQGGGEEAMYCACCTALLAGLCIGEMF